MQLDLSHLIYFFLSLLTIFVAYRNGKNIARKQSDIQLKDFSPTIVAYTLFAGLRWGRGIDYNLYYTVYKEIGQGLNEGWEPLFYAVCRTLSFIGMPWQAMVMLMSFLLIFSLCKYFTSFKTQLYVILPFLVMNLNDAENVMRWYMAFSFFMLAFAYYQEKGSNYLRYSLVFLAACLLTHYGFVIPAMIFVGLYILNEYIDISPHIAMALYIVVIFMFETDMMMYFDSYMQQINLGTRFAMYQNNSEAWLTGSANDFNETDTGFSLIKFLPNVAIIYLGAMWRGMCKTKREKYLYTLAVFSIVFSPIASQIELLYRVNSVFAIFKVIVIAIFFDMYKKNYVKNKLLKVMLLIVFLLKVFTITSYPLTCKGIDTYFVWDAHGRHTLDRGI